MCMLNVRVTSLLTRIDIQTISQLDSTMANMHRVNYMLNHLQRCNDSTMANMHKVTYMLNQLQRWKGSTIANMHKVTFMLNKLQ